MQSANHTLRKSRSTHGFTLVEIMITLTVITVAVYLMSSTLTATMAHSAKRKERTFAIEAAMNTLERMRAVPFTELVYQYNDDKDDDVDGVGTAPGANFEVPGLQPIEGQEFVGTIRMPFKMGDVREDLVIPELGMPRDLNGDFRVDSDDHSHSYMILPVEVVVEWQGAAGKSKLAIKSMYAAVQRQLQ